MIYKEMLSITTILMVWAIIFFIKLFLKEAEKTSAFDKYGTIVVLILSVVSIVWLCFNKELFHWNYDIATGEPVDHYSTYNRCVIYTVISLVCSAVSTVVRIFRKRDENR